MAWPIASGASEADMESELAARLAVMGVIINRMTWRDARTLTGLVTAPEDGLVGEFSLSRRGRVLFLVAIGSPESSASATESFRKKFVREDFAISY
jgi:hypothetical protein